jgi:predicted DNA-binding transcriptional regulator AlpA
VHHLVGVTEIAEMLGLSRQRVNQMVRDDPVFPRPEAELTGGRVWRTEVIEEWARETGRLPRQRP